jgi:hypothetical protein
MFCCCCCARCATSKLLAVGKSSAIWARLLLQMLPSLVAVKMTAAATVSRINCSGEHPKGTPFGVVCRAAQKPFLQDQFMVYR